MGRPRCNYNIGCCPPSMAFKPENMEGNDVIEISREEIESLRLKNIQNYDQTKAASHLGVSQSTFQRILTQAYKKVSRAIIEGKELRII